MTASNLSICVGPSILWSSDQAYMMDQNYSKEVSALVQILVEDFTKIFGGDVPDMFQHQVRAAWRKISLTMSPPRSEVSRWALQEGLVPLRDKTRCRARAPRRARAGVSALLQALGH